MRSSPSPKKKKKDAEASVAPVTAVAPDPDADEELGSAPVEEPPTAGKYEDLSPETRILGHKIQRLTDRLAEAEQAKREAVEKLAMSGTAAPVTTTTIPGVQAGCRPVAAHDAWEITLRVDGRLAVSAGANDYQRTMLFHSIGTVVRALLDQPPFNLSGKATAHGPSPVTVRPDPFPGSVAGVKGIAPGEYLPEETLRSRLKELRDSTRSDADMVPESPIGVTQMERTTSRHEQIMREKKEARERLNRMSRESMMVTSGIFGPRNTDEWAAGLARFMPPAPPLSLMDRIFKVLNTPIGDLF